MTSQTDKMPDEPGLMFVDRDGILADRKPEVFRETQVQSRLIRQYNVISDMLTQLNVNPHHDLIVQVRDLVNEWRAHGH